MREPRILVSRTDRLGDVIMALPALAYLREALPNWEIDFLCRPDYGELLTPFLRAKRIGQLSFPDALSAFSARHYRAALILHTELPVLWAAAKVRVPLRIGPYSKPASFLLLNAGVSQHRSRAEANEGEYNLRLARELVKRLTGQLIAKAPARLEIPGDETSRRAAGVALRSLGLAEGQSFVLVHPGMGGSALNPSVDKYRDVIGTLRRSFGLPVILSEGPSAYDREMVASLAGAVPGLEVLRGQKLPVLREVFRLADAVVAPSTGPLHLAHYVGTRTIGLYPPVRSQRRERWEPWGGTGRSEVFSPDLSCPAEKECLGPRCEDYLCMDRVAWSSLILQQRGGLRESSTEN